MGRLTVSACGEVRYVERWMARRFEAIVGDGAWKLAAISQDRTALLDIMGQDRCSIAEGPRARQLTGGAHSS